MKYFVKLFVITLFVFVASYAHANQIIRFIDMNFVMNQSKAGAEAQKLLVDIQKDNIKKFKKIENELKVEETKLVSKKKILNKEEYQKLVNRLREKAKNYENDRRNMLTKVNKLRLEAREKLLSAIQPILDNYVNENNIDIILDKKNLILGKKDKDITEVIIKLLNDKIVTLNLQ